MEIDLRYCKKCKRNTLQVSQKVLTFEAARALAEVQQWSRQVRRDFNKSKEQEHYLEQTWYCPCCGKRWIEISPPKPDMYIDEFRKCIAQII